MGQTTRPLHRRMNGHRACFVLVEAKLEKSALSLHAFQKHPEAFSLSNFEFTVLCQVGPLALDRQEYFFIEKFSSTNTRGLNRMVVTRQRFALTHTHFVHAVGVRTGFLPHFFICHVFHFYPVFSFLVFKFLRGGRGVQGNIFGRISFELWALQVPLMIGETFGKVPGPRRPTVSEPRPAQKLGVK